MFDKKEREVTRLLERHLSLVQQCVQEMQKLFTDYLQLDSDFKEEAYLIDQLETEADDVRREIHRKLYEGAFLPIHRGDFIRLVETNDEVANGAESVADFLVLTRPMIPEFLREDLVKMIETTVEMYGLMPGLLEAYQSDIERVRLTVEQISDWEEKVDKLLWDTTKRIFKSDLDLAQKLHLRTFARLIATLSDEMEDTAERVQAMVVKGTF